jgi:hypothetical protein
MLRDAPLAHVFIILIIFISDWVCQSTNKIWSSLVADWSWWYLSLDILFNNIDCLTFSDRTILRRRTWASYLVWRPILFDLLLGTDTVLSNVLLTYVVDQNWHDIDFIGEHVQGFDKAVTINRVTLEGRSRNTGLSIEQIRKAAH